MNRSKESVISKILARSKSPREADFLPAVFGRSVDAALSGDRPLVLYGAGSAGRELLPLFTLHGLKVDCFCDGDPRRVGTNVNGVRVVSVQVLIKDYSRSHVVITAGGGHVDIMEGLVRLGFESNQIFFFRDQTALAYYTHINQWAWSQEDLILHEKQLEIAFSSLSDQRSREIFLARIALFLRGSDYKSFRSYLDRFSDARTLRQDGTVAREYYHYFNNDVLRLGRNEVLVDGGAFNGDSAREFIAACDRQSLPYSAIFCYEPDPGIFKELSASTAMTPLIQNRPFGLWSSCVKLQLATSEVMGRERSRVIQFGDHSHGATEENKNGIIEISTTTIDADCAHWPVSIIKLDIEGAEREALVGARQTIKLRRPKMIISAYHMRNDLFELINLIREIQPSYRFYLRHFSNWFGELVIIAVPA